MKAKAASLIWFVLILALAIVWDSYRGKNPYHLFWEVALTGTLFILWLIFWPGWPGATVAREHNEQVIRKFRILRMSNLLLMFFLVLWVTVLTWMSSQTMYTQLYHSDLYTSLPYEEFFRGRGFHLYLGLLVVLLPAAATFFVLFWRCPGCHGHLWILNWPTLVYQWWQCPICHRFRILMPWLDPCCCPRCGTPLR